MNEITIEETNQLLSKILCITTNDPEIQKHPELVNKEQDKVGTPKILYLTKVVHQQQRFNLFSILNVWARKF